MGEAVESAYFLFGVSLHYADTFPSMRKVLFSGEWSTLKSELALKA